MTQTLHLPAVYGNPDVTPARQFVTAWMLALGERAAIMRQDDRLTNCARIHANYLANREDMTPSMHIGANNSTPNQRLIASGYRPPSFWKPERNNCEACAVHHAGPVDALIMLLDSPTHRPILLGEKVSDWFWHLHTQWGLANAAAFYVLICAPPEGSQG